MNKVIAIITQYINCGGRIVVKAGRVVNIVRERGDTVCLLCERCFRVADAS